METYLRALIDCGGVGFWWSGAVEAQACRSRALSGSRWGWLLVAGVGYQITDRVVREVIAALAELLLVTTHRS